MTADAIDGRRYSVGILHAERRDSDIRLTECLQRLGAVVNLLDVGIASKLSYKEYSCILNRVYPSTIFARPYGLLATTLSIARELETQSVPVINGVNATRADYSKLFSATQLRDKGVRTPITLSITEEVANNPPPFIPAVIKLDTGGFGRECFKVDNDEEWREILNTVDWRCRPRIVQEYIRSILPYDFRITVMFGEPLLAYRRTLASGWIGSSEQGSIASLAPNIPSSAISLAVHSSRAIEARVNAVDLKIDEGGPVVIENNPTPAFSQISVDGIEIDLVQRFAENVILYLHRLEARKLEAS
jgi:glutathione synthase/RimK-type ligase-like ATP-grasp enzyme